MTERMRLISYLLYGFFSAILKKNTIKTPEATFHIRLRVLGLSSSLIRKKYLYASFFLSVIENIVVLCPSFLLFSPTRTQFYSQLKRAVEPRKKFIMPGHYKKIMPAQQPSERAYYCSHVIKQNLARM